MAKENYSQGHRSRKRTDFIPITMEMSQSDHCSEKPFFKLGNAPISCAWRPKNNKTLFLWHSRFTFFCFRNIYFWKQLAVGFPRMSFGQLGCSFPWISLPDLWDCNKVCSCCRGRARTHFHSEIPFVGAIELKGVKEQNEQRWYEFGMLLRMWISENFFVTQYRRKQKRYFDKPLATMLRTSSTMHTTCHLSCSQGTKAASISSPCLSHPVILIPVFSAANSTELCTNREQCTGIHFFIFWGQNTSLHVPVGGLQDASPFGLSLLWLNFPELLVYNCGYLTALDCFSSAISDNFVRQDKLKGFGPVSVIVWGTVGYARRVDLVQKARVCDKVEVDPLNFPKIHKKIHKNIRTFVGVVLKRKCCGRTTSFNGQCEEHCPLPMMQMFLQWHKRRISLH